MWKYRKGFVEEVDVVRKVKEVRNDQMVVCTDSEERRGLW